MWDFLSGNAFPSEFLLSRGLEPSKHISLKYSTPRRAAMSGTDTDDEDAWAQAAATSDTEAAIASLGACVKRTAPSAAGSQASSARPRRSPLP